MATVAGGFCRHHALALELELEEESPLDRLFEIADRALAGRLRKDEIASAIGGMVGGWVGQMMKGVPMPPGMPPGMHGIPTSPGTGPRARAGSPPRPPPRAAPDPQVEARRLARITLGFDETEKLTAELVKDRKRALARVFHPDTGKGSVAHMQRINQAADLLLKEIG